MLAITLLGSICAAPAWGGVGAAIVYDPTNHIENVRQAVEAIRISALNESQLAQQVLIALNTGRQYVQMLKDYQVQVNSLRGMSAAQIFSLAKTLGGEAALYADLAERVSRTDRNLRGVLDMYRDIERVGNYTDMSPEQIFWQERYRKQQENSYTRDRFANIQRTLASVQNDIERITQLAAAIPDSSAEGEQSLRKSVEVVATHLNVIAGQNTQLLALLAEEAAAKSASAVSQRTISEAQEYNQYAQQYREQWRIRQRYQEASAAARERWVSLPNGPLDAHADR
ncbi:MAG TPA: hypothetical protein VN878_02035 [Usitatibacter sp.]|nr:hypothetical protein [Usitatibacter sp.]